MKTNVRISSPSYLRGVYERNTTPPASDTSVRLVGANVVPTSFDIWPDVHFKIIIPDTFFKIVVAGDVFPRFSTPYF